MNSAQIHPLSDVQSGGIAKGTRVWQYCVIFPNEKIGKNCHTCAQVLIENDIVTGDNATSKSEAQLWGRARIGDYVFIGPNATFMSDQFLKAEIKDGSSIGVNATILLGPTIREGAMFDAGVMVTRSVLAGHRCRQSSAHRRVAGVRS